MPKIGQAWETFVQQALATGYRLGNQGREVYKDGHAFDAEDNGTELHMGWVAQERAGEMPSSPAQKSQRNGFREAALVELINNSNGMELILLPAGSFVMGGDWDAEQADENELPQHEVTLNQPFYIGRTPVTQSQWEAVMGSNPSEFKDSDHPVETVSHEDAAEFLKRLNQSEDNPGYRLPTEAEWEYAARAGSASTYCFGPQVAKLPEYAWFQKNSARATHPVGQLAPNDWGLYDMHGNVHEWCADWFDRTYYARSPATNPLGPRKGAARALRGGDWGSEAWYCRCAIRSLSAPTRRSPRVGFRIVKPLDPPVRSRKPRGVVSKVFSRR